MEAMRYDTLRVELSRGQLHFRKPARTSRGAYTEHDMLLVRLTDPGTGRTAVGECAPLPDLSSDRHAYVHLTEVEALLREALASGDPSERLRPYPALLFALESALAELQSDASLFDTPFARGEVGIPINGLVWMSDFDDMLRQVEAKLSQGFRCIKLKIGAIEWEKELTLLRHIRSRFTADRLELRVDANGAFSVGEAPGKLAELARLDIHSIEQPIRQGQWPEMARLCADTPLPIALDEELIGLTATTERIAMLDAIRPQYIVVKPTLHGGLSGARQWIDLARERGIGSWITSALESNIGLRSIALLAARQYGAGCTFPQGLGTGQLFTDNIETGIAIRGERLWMTRP